MDTSPLTVNDREITVQPAAGSSGDEYTLLTGEWGARARVNASGSVDLSPFGDADGMPMDDEDFHRCVLDALRARTQR